MSWVLNPSPAGWNLHNIQRRGWRYFRTFLFFWARQLYLSMNCLTGIILQVEFPIFQDLNQLPTPLGTLFYTQVHLGCYFGVLEKVYLLSFGLSVNWSSSHHVQFSRLPLVDRLTSLPLMAAGTLLLFLVLVFLKCLNQLHLNRIETMRSVCLWRY